MCIDHIWQKLQTPKIITYNWPFFRKKSNVRCCNSIFNWIKLLLVKASNWTCSPFPLHQQQQRYSWGDFKIPKEKSKNQFLFVLESRIIGQCKINNSFFSRSWTVVVVVALITTLLMSRSQLNWEITKLEIFPPLLVPLFSFFLNSASKTKNTLSKLCHFNESEAQEKITLLFLKSNPYFLRLLFSLMRDHFWPLKYKLASENLLKSGK